MWLLTPLVILPLLEWLWLWTSGYSLPPPLTWSYALSYGLLVGFDLPGELETVSLSPEARTHLSEFTVSLPHRET